MKKTFLALTIGTILLYACTERVHELDSTQACQDHLIAENIFNEVGYIIEEGLEGHAKKKSCPNYIREDAPDTSGIDTLIIDFGSTNCVHNNKEKRGVIHVTYTGKHRDYLSVTTTTFIDYYVNNNLVQGKRIATNQGFNENGNMWFTIDVDSDSIKTSNGTIDWKSNIVREWINGQNTLDISEHRYKITGSASGIGTNNNAFTMNITDALHVDSGCLPSCVIKTGTAKISPNGYADRIINYGSSLCDCNVNVIIDEKTYPIVIGN